MRNAIGNALLFNIVITMIVLMIAFLTASLSYSKAFRVKNNIVSSIEANGYDKSKIDGMLREIGYRIVKTQTAACVDRRGGGKLLAGSNAGNYRYCVYEYNTNRGKFYGVTSFMYFDIPLVEDRLEFPIYGETRVFMDLSGN